VNPFAAFPALCLRYGRPAHLVHAGAHAGQEMVFYRQAAVPRVTLIEPIPELAAQLRTAYPEATVVECACGAAAGRAVLSVTRPSNMSTLGAPEERLVERRIDVTVRRLDAVAPDADAAVVDAQGLELKVLAGAPWRSLRMVIVETCTVDDPTMASPHEEVAAAMASQGFAEVERWVRDYDDVNRWARGAQMPPRSGEVRDVVFVREAP